MICFEQNRLHYGTQTDRQKVFPFVINLLLRLYTIVTYGFLTEVHHFHYMDIFQTIYSKLPFCFIQTPDVFALLDKNFVIKIRTN